MHSRYRILYTLGVATALLVSCTSEEPDGDDKGASETYESCAIRFTGTTADLVSRADALPDDYSLWVQALHHDGNCSHTLYFDAPQEFGCADGVWKGVASDYYYPLTGTLEFLAFALHDGATQTPQVSYTIQPDGQALAAMTLDFGTKLTGTDDAVLFSDTKSADRASAIPALKLRHALSKIVVEARTTSAQTAHDLILRQVTLKQLRPSGTLTVAAAPTSQVTVEETTVEIGSEAQWTALAGTPADFELMGSSASVAPLLVSSDTQPGTPLGHPLYMPTQSATPTDLAIDIYYSLVNAQAISPTYRRSITLGSVKWLPGITYIYTLDCNITEICISASAIIDGVTEVLIDSEQIELDNLKP